jgi:hypothetical protein
MAMKQTTLMGFEKYGKTTRRAQFLSDDVARLERFELPSFWFVVRQDRQSVN